MRIAHVVHGFPPWDRAGVPKYVDLVAAEQVRMGLEVFVLCASRGRGRSRSTESGVSVVGIPVPRLPGAHLRSVFSRLVYTVAVQAIGCGWARRNRIELVHGHTIRHGGVQAARLAAAVGVPLVITLHGMAVDRFAVGDAPPFWPQLRSARHFICQKAAARDRLISWGAPTDAVSIILGPIDVRRPVPGRAKPHHPVVLMVGRLEQVKRPTLLVEALPHLLRLEPEARVEFAGDGPCVPDLETLARKLGVASRVHFLGWVDDTGQSMESAAVSAFLSAQHNCSDLALLEAMSKGVPVVATPSLGIEEVIQDGVTGWMAEPTPEGLAATLATVMNGSDAVRAAATRAQEWVVEACSTEAVSSSMVEIYRRVLAGSVPLSSGNPGHRRSG